MLIGCLLRRAGQIFFLALIGVGNVQAETVGQSGLPGEWLQCLRRDDASPLYTEKILESRVDGFVRVKLSFERGDRPPVVEVLARALPNEMLEVVKDYLSRYRLPCLPDGRAVVAVQEFRLSPFSSQGLTSTDLRDVSESPGASIEKCIRTPAEPLRPPTNWSRRRDVSGNLLLNLRFDTADGPPRVTVLYNSTPSDYRDAVLYYVDQYRAPCFVKGGDPFIVAQQFMVRSLDVHQRQSLENQDIFKFMEQIKGLEREKVRFDFNTMSCPFQVVWRAGMPIRKNWVSEIGSRDLNRTEFLAWLSGLSLNVSADAMEQLLGETMKIDVPCTVLELGN